MSKINLPFTGFLIVFLCAGCANFLTITANKGITYGMSQEAVVKVNEKKGYKIIRQDENIIIVEGMQEQLKQPAEKTFHFENGRLISIEEKIK